MPETRVLAVADLGLDRAWPALGPRRGAQRREQAREALVHLVGMARQQADVLVVAGGLLDRRSVEPATLDLVARLFAAFPGTVVLVPGILDWYSADSPYATTDWPDNVQVVTQPSGQVIPLPTGLALWACAVTSPLRTQLTVPGPGRAGGQGHVALLPGAFDGDERHLDDAGVAHLLMAGPEPNLRSGRVTPVAPVAPAVPADSGAASAGGATALRFDDTGRVVSPREQISLPMPPLDVVDVDVSGLPSTESVLAAVRDAAEGGAALIRLRGMVRAGVLLPQYVDDGGLDVPLDLSALQYELVRPPEDDRTAAAEFVRDLIERPGRVADRHQAVALGLQALDGARATRPTAESA